MPDDELDDLYPDATLEPLTPDSITDREELRHVLAQVRRDGVAWDECESNAAVNCVAAPVFDHRGDPIGAVGVVGPVERLLPDGPSPVLVTAVKETGRGLSRDMGAGRVAARR